MIVLRGNLSKISSGCQMLFDLLAVTAISGRLQVYPPPLLDAPDQFADSVISQVWAGIDVGRFFNPFVVSCFGNSK